MEDLRSSASSPVPLPGKWSSLTFLAAGEALAMGLWFSASAVAPQLTAEWSLSPGQQAWMTMSVQLGFVAGALASAISNLSDRVASHRLIAVSALVGALLTVLIVLPGVGPGITLGCRFLVGAAMAGVYPPGMKLVATWSTHDRGLGIGLLVGALTLGNALPHLLNAIPILGADGLPPWRPVLIVASALAALAAWLILIFVRPGPHLSQTAPFDWRYAGRALSHQPTRLANFGYLGHMWELYAMWTWVPMFLMASYAGAGWNRANARLAGFAVIAVGGLGSLLAGLLADRMGRCNISVASLGISGGCCLLAGFFFSTPAVLTPLCLIWGFSVVADSAQFSAAVSELTDPLYVGTALTTQTCLGFLLTTVTIKLIPSLQELLGWEWVFVSLAIGPALGALSMLRLRRLPEATRMASGHR